ncbi:leucine-rich repeat-containing protein 15 isoform X1 [Lucilia cuprina]|uniref:leucine-rich repeat-containing protein 15 isoform X1 n=1 Tax=Lucilia cuprina TaxID=7375 RepID=UPI001F06487A|nr:leucine-rich repeat-containing protein 15 isoform X1 [Lucilia cuprina]
MFLFKEIFICICLIFTVYAENSINNCPRFCECDSYLQLNRAQCSSKRLISAEVELPYQVQILDLSYNDITTVDKKCFENFSHLKHLNLSNNALHTLDWESFSKLRRLSEIDLSYNRLEYLDDRLFARNKYLLKINLEGNKLESLQHKTLLNNPFVEELNLKNSQLFVLQPELFSGLPNLRKLDLSKNLLNNFNTEDFEYLKKLEYLNLNENSIKCDATIKNKLSLLEKRGINVTLDNCFREINGNFKRATEMFEKMVMAAAPIEEDDHLNKIHEWRSNIDLEEDSDEDIDSKENNHQVIRKNNEWLRFAPDTILCNKQNFVLCQEYRSCLQDLNKAWHEQRIIKEQCPLHDIKLAFFMGIAIGASAIVFILACALCMKRCLEVKKSVPPLDRIDDLPTQPLARPTSQLPPQVRRQPRRRTAPPPRSMVRYEGPVGENFLSRLFGRPARQQYYRSINQNTATLIRRLSRSNLFNNRLSQHFAERQNSSEPNSPVEEDFRPSAPRPETPPPSYGDVVINNCSNAK